MIKMKQSDIKRLLCGFFSKHQVCIDLETLSDEELAALQYTRIAYSRGTNGVTGILCVGADQRLYGAVGNVSRF